MNVQVENQTLEFKINNLTSKIQGEMFVGGISLFGIEHASFNISHCRNRVLPLN
jgi:hypothetical protein